VKSALALRDLADAILGLAFQAAALIALVLLLRLDWVSILERRESRPAAPPAAG
jgi:hypothetical protein